MTRLKLSAFFPTLQLWEQDTTGKSAEGRWAWVKGGIRGEGVRKQVNEKPKAGWRCVRNEGLKGIEATEV